MRIGINVSNQIEVKVYVETDFERPSLFETGKTNTERKFSCLEVVGINPLINDLFFLFIQGKECPELTILLVLREFRLSFSHYLYYNLYQS